MIEVIEVLDAKNVLYKIEVFRNAKNISYLDATVLYCKENDIEVESIAELIKKDPTFKMMLTADAQRLNLLKVTSTATPL